MYFDHNIQKDSVSFCVETLWSYTTQKKNELMTKMLELAVLKYHKVHENDSISHLGWVCPSYGQSLWQTLWRHSCLSASVNQKNWQDTKPQVDSVFAIGRTKRGAGTWHTSSCISSAMIHLFHEYPHYPKQARPQRIIGWQVGGWSTDADSSWDPAWGQEPVCITHCFVHLCSVNIDGWKCLENSADVPMSHSD